MVAFRLVTFSNIEVCYEVRRQRHCSVFGFLRGRYKELKDKEANMCVVIKV